MQVYLTRLMKQRLIENAIASVAAVGILNGAKLNLGTVLTDLSANTALADLVGQVANFTGYAVKTLVFSPPTLAEDGAMATIGEHPEFRPTDAVIPNTIKNAWVTDTTGADLLMVIQFDGEGLPMNSVLNHIDLGIVFKPNGTVTVDIIG